MVQPARRVQPYQSNDRKILGYEVMYCWPMRTESDSNSIFILIMQLESSTKAKCYLNGCILAIFTVFAKADRPTNGVYSPVLTSFSVSSVMPNLRLLFVPICEVIVYFWLLGLLKFHSVLLLTQTFTTCVRNVHMG